MGGVPRLRRMPLSGEVGSTSGRRGDMRRTPMAAALVEAAWCRSCQYNQRGLCLYCRNDGADDTIAEACTRRASEWLGEEAE